MKALTVTVEPGPRALYLRIADSVRRAIREGRVRPGERLPSSRSLALTLGAHRQTVMEALGELVAEGWLEAEARRGYLVAGSLPDDLTRPRRSGSPAPSPPMRWRLARDLRSPAEPTPAPVRHSFRSHPDLRLFPFAEFRACLGETLRRSRPERFGYGDPGGHPELVAELTTYLRRARALTERRVLVTHGSQEALFLVGQLLVSPGDEVAVESPGYPPAAATFRCAGARIVPLPVDHEGLDPAAFEALVRRRPPRLLYLTPLHQFPTTVTLPAPRRLAIYALAARHGVAVVEDDYDHEFHYRCQPLAPMASEDPAGIVIHVSSLSKVLFPSARVGLIAAPAALHEPLCALRRVVSHQNDFLTQDALARWIRSGGFERHLRKMRRVYEERRDALDACLEAERARGRDLRWCSPDGGMATWVGLPGDARRVSAEAARRGVQALAEEPGVGAPAVRRSLRLGFSMQSPDELRRGFRLLMEALERALPCGPQGRPW